MSADKPIQTTIRLKGQPDVELLRNPKTGKWFLAKVKDVGTDKRGVLLSVYNAVFTEHEVSAAPSRYFFASNRY